MIDTLEFFSVNRTVKSSSSTKIQRNSIGKLWKLKIKQETIFIVLRPIGISMACDRNIFVSRFYFDAMCDEYYRRLTSYDGQPKFQNRAEKKKQKSYIIRV